jgi:hypothetical protein
VDRVASLNSRPQDVVEIVAAVIGAAATGAVTAGVMGVGGANRRVNEGRDAVIKLTAAVEHVASRLESLHVDIKADRRETYSRLNALEQEKADGKETRARLNVLETQVAKLQAFHDVQP